MLARIREIRLDSHGIKRVHAGGRREGRSAGDVGSIRGWHCYVRTEVPSRLHQDRGGGSDLWSRCRGSLPSVNTLSYPEGHPQSDAYKDQPTCNSDDPPVISDPCSRFISTQNAYSKKRSEHSCSKEDQEREALDGTV